MSKVKITCPFCEETYEVENSDELRRCFCGAETVGYRKDGKINWTKRMIGPAENVEMVFVGVCECGLKVAYKLKDVENTRGKCFCGRKIRWTVENKSDWENQLRRYGRIK